MKIPIAIFACSCVLWLGACVLTEPVSPAPRPSPVPPPVSSKTYRINQVGPDGRIVRSYRTKAFTESFSPAQLTFTDSSGVARTVTGSYDVHLEN